MQFLHHKAAEGKQNRSTFMCNEYKKRGDESQDLLSLVMSRYKEEPETWPTHPGFHRGFSIPLSHLKNREVSWTYSSRSDSCFFGFKEPEDVYAFIILTHDFISILSDISGLHLS